MPADGKYKRGMLIRSQTSNCYYLITAVYTNKFEEVRYDVLPLMNPDSAALELHGTCFYSLGKTDLNSKYEVIGEFDLDILRPKYILGEQLSKRFGERSEEEKDISLEERIDKIEEKLNDLIENLGFDDDDGK